MAASGVAHSALRIFACEPEWAALAEEIGGDRVKVFTATTPFQDAHHIEARPSLIAKVRRADMLICTGAELEVGWLPLLLRQSGTSLPDSDLVRQRRYSDRSARLFSRGRGGRPTGSA